MRYLKDIYMLQGTRSGRVFDTIIVDEIDSMFVDEYGKKTILTAEKPYMSKLN